MTARSPSLSPASSPSSGICVVRGYAVRSSRDSLSTSGAYNSRWVQPGGSDSKTFDALVQLRNALGHGNETQLRGLISSANAKDNVSWARGQLPVLNRYASALDHIVWDYLKKTTGSEPWS